MWKFLIGWMFHSACNCSKERFGNAIIGLGEQEIREMIDEDGKAEAHCHFCLETYVYPKEELKALSMKYGRNLNVETGKSAKTQTKDETTSHVIGILLVCNIFWFIGWLIPDKPKQTDEEVASVAGEPITREQWMTAMEKEVGRETLLDLVNDKVMEVAAERIWD